MEKVYFQLPLTIANSIIWHFVVLASWKNKYYNLYFLFLKNCVSVTVARPDYSNINTHVK